MAVFEKYAGFLFEKLKQAYFKMLNQSILMYMINFLCMTIKTTTVCS